LRIQKVKNFKILGYEISYENEKDIQHKQSTFSQILGILKNGFRPTLAHKFSRKKVYNALVLPILLYGSEICTLRKKDKKRLTSIKMKFCRRTAGYSLLDHKRKETIWKSR
jgi:hypothetical protein